MIGHWFIHSLIYSPIHWQWIEKKKEKKLRLKDIKDLFTSSWFNAWNQLILKNFDSWQISLDHELILFSICLIPTESFPPPGDFSDFSLSLILIGFFLSFSRKSDCILESYLFLFRKKKFSNPFHIHRHVSIYFSNQHIKIRNRAETNLMIIDKRGGGSMYTQIW